MLTACIPSRWSLWRHLTTGWPHFAAYGAPRSGKTFTAYVVCAIFGIPTDETPGANVSAIHNALRETGKSLFGRRTRRASKIVIEPARELGLPFVLADELDKRSGSFLDELLAVLDGGTVARLEGCEVRIRYTPLVCWNTAMGAAPPGFYHGAYESRGVVLDTRTVGLAADTLGPQVAALLKPGALPRFRLADLHPRAEVAEAAYPTVAATLRKWLTRRGASLTDARFVSRIVPGWVALAGQRAEVAARNVALAYLTVSETLDGFVKPSYREAILSELTGALMPSRGPANVADDEPEVTVPEEEAEGAGFDFAMLCAAWADACRAGLVEAARHGYHGTRKPRSADYAVPTTTTIADAVCRTVSLPLWLAREGQYDTRAVSKVYKAGEKQGLRIGYALGWRAAHAEQEAAVRAAVLNAEGRDIPGSLWAALGDGTPEGSPGLQNVTAGLPALPSGKRQAADKKPAPASQTRRTRTTHRSAPPVFTVSGGRLPRPATA